MYQILKKIIKIFCMGIHFQDIRLTVIIWTLIHFLKKKMKCIWKGMHVSKLKKLVRAVLWDPLPRSKIDLHNLDYFKFPTEKKVIQSKMHLKEIYVLNLKKIVRDIFSKTHIQNLKLLFIIEVFINLQRKEVILSKWHLKGMYASNLKKIVRVVYEIFTWCSI